PPAHRSRARPARRPSARAQRPGGRPVWRASCPPSPEAASACRRALTEVLAPESVVADVHDAIAVEVGPVATIGRPEALPPDPVVPDVHDAVTVKVSDDARGRWNATECASEYVIRHVPALADPLGLVERPMDTE